MKTIFIIIDGMGGKIAQNTPLCKAKTPNLDYLAKKGKTGLVQTVNKGIAPESDVAVVSLLGYNPYEYHHGRGPFEAYGLGLHIHKGEIALRCNFATISGNTIIERRAGRTVTTKEAEQLTKEINKKVYFDDPKAYFIFKHSTEHRAVLILGYKGKALSAEVSNLDPGYSKEGNFGIANKDVKLKINKVRPLAKTSAARLTAKLLNEFFLKSHKVLQKSKVNKQRILNSLLPANAILMRDAGDTLPKLPDINKRFHKKWAAIVGMPLERGIAKRAGMQILPITYPELKSTNIYNHLYESLITEIYTAKQYLRKEKNYDAFYIHFKETDIPGHDGRPKDKQKMLEILDKEFFSFLRTLKNTKIVVTADHATPCELKAHSSDPVPILVYDGKNKDKVDRFCESDCKKGSIKIENGWKLMSSLF